MPTLTIRNLDEAVRDDLRISAAAHGRSMEAEVRSILKWYTQRGKTQPGAVAKRVHERFASIGGGDDLHIPGRESMPEPVALDE